MAVNIAAGNEGRYGTIDNAVLLDVVRREVGLLIGRGRVESDLERTEVVELDGLGVLEMLFHHVAELDEHSCNVGAGDSRGVADLLSEHLCRDSTHADGSAVPLTKGLTTCDLVLNNFKSYWHNFLIYAFAKEQRRKNMEYIGPMLQYPIS